MPDRDHLQRLISEADSPEELIQQASGEEARHEFMSGLEMKGRQFVREQDVERDQLHTVEVGFLLTLREYLDTIPAKSA